MPREGGEDVGSFIHTLGLVNGVWCLDVPAELGLADHPGALAVSPDGSRLFAASSIGGVAGYLVNDVITFGPQMPRGAHDRDARRHGPARRDGSFAATKSSSPSEARCSVSIQSRSTVRDSFTWDMDVEALTVLDDGSIVIVGNGTDDDGVADQRDHRRADPARRKRPRSPRRVLD